MDTLVAAYNSLEASRVAKLDEIVDHMRARSGYRQVRFTSGNSPNSETVDVLQHFDSPLDLVRQQSSLLRQRTITGYSEGEA
jgi:hypothetical protein